MAGNVLVTGAAGFLGSHLCDRFIHEGYKVIGMDNLLTGNIRNIEHLFGNDQFQFVKHDVSEYTHVSGELDYILHFASPASPKDYLKLPIQTLKVGSLGTHKILGLARAKNARVLIASTSEVYGDPLIHPQQENYWGNVNPIGYRGVYDEAKRFGETLVAHFQREHKVNAGIIRIFNTYGHNMDPFDGRVVSTFIRQALAGEPLTVFGDGAQTRSFCFIEDLIRGIVSMGVSDHTGPINLGNPEERDLLDLAQIVLRITKSNSELKFLPLPEDDPKRRCPDITKAREVLNWSPEVGIEEGITRTAEWIASQNTEIKSHNAS
jgi:dTDP-glucose 4,6-dehydratase